jgi:hypothetical protein
MKKIKDTITLAIEMARKDPKASNTQLAKRMASRVDRDQNLRRQVQVQFCEREFVLARKYLARLADNGKSRKLKEKRNRESDAKVASRLRELREMLFGSLTSDELAKAIARKRTKEAAQ